MSSFWIFSKWDLVRASNPGRFASLVMTVKHFDALLPPPPVHVFPVDTIIRFDLIVCVPFPHTSPIGGVKRELIDIYPG